MMAIECQIMEAAVGDLMLIRDSAKPPTPLSFSSTIARGRDADGYPYFLPKGEPWTRSGWGRLNRLGKRPDWSDTLGIEDHSKIEKKPDAWNRIECRCQGTSIHVKLNGQLVNVVKDVRPSSGKILLQCEGSEIFFRKVELIRL